MWGDKQVINGRKYGMEIVCFERSVLSPILEFIADSDRRLKALNMIKEGAIRLKQTPREDMPNSPMTSAANLKLIGKKKIESDLN